MTSDLPLTKDPTSRYVPWIVGLMMYLGMLSVLLFCLFQSYFKGWTEDIDRSFSVEIYSPQADLLKQENQLESQAQLIKNFLESFPGIFGVTLLDQEQISQLLTSWLGDMNALQEVGLPIYLEGKIRKRSPSNLKIIEQKVQEIYPFSKVIDHGIHFAPLQKLGISLKIFILVMLGAFFAASIVTLSFSVQTSLLIHKPIIDILSFLGANDIYIAREFKRHAMYMAMRGAIFAFILMIATFFVGFWIFRESDIFSLSLFSLKDTYYAWMLSLFVPFIMSMLMVFFSHYRVKAMLKELI